MSKNNNIPYFNPGRFSTPPPLINNSPNWNSFKVPLQPQTPSPPRYRNQVIRNGESPNSISAGSTELSSASKNNYMNNNVSHTQGSNMQLFDVPPPPINTTSPYVMNTSMQSMPTTGYENQNLLYMYRSPLAAQYAYSMSQNQYQLGSSLQFSPTQPPLPPVPPPQNPPPPPPPVTMAQSPQGMVNHHYTNYQNRMPFSPMFSYQKQNMYKRKYDGEGKKQVKKKKKPLSQVVPQKRDWSLAEARKALDIEKECNKNSKRQGLIIKFPDLELNRDIVSNFHSSIESVHFQQPCTPRYCFITLRESADPETVIKQLNQIPFGLGHLTAEFKKDREDEQNLQPSDIDPLTLYVGNLAQEITKEDMIKTYPKQKRIDIGYAKKMKYTRYAFVSFNNVNDAIEAFKTTHSAQLHSKSLIVRFRRIHGTVGMPGEPKQNNPRQDSISSNSEPPNDNDKPEEASTGDLDISTWDAEETEPKFKRSESPYTTEDEEEEEELDIKPPPPPLKTNFRPGSFDLAFEQHRPMMIKEDKKFLEINHDVADVHCVASNVPETTNSTSDTKPAISDIKRENESKYSTTSYDHLRNLNRHIRTGQIKVKHEDDMIIKDNTEKPITLDADNEQVNSANELSIQGIDRISEIGDAAAQKNVDSNISNDKETKKTAEREISNFDGNNYSSTVVKTERDDDYGSDSSEGEMNLEQLLAQAKKRAQNSK